MAPSPSSIGPRESRTRCSDPSAHAVAATVCIVAENGVVDINLLVLHWYENFEEDPTIRSKPKSVKIRVESLGIVLTHIRQRLQRDAEDGLLRRLDCTCSATALAFPALPVSRRPFLNAPPKKAKSQ